jgi:hypothetical protein
MVESPDAKWLECGADINVAAEGEHTIANTVRNNIDAGLSNGFVDLPISADRTVDYAAKSGTRDHRKSIRTDSRKRARALPQFGRRQSRPPNGRKTGKLICRLREKPKKI